MRLSPQKARAETSEPAARTALRLKGDGRIASWSEEARRLLGPDLQKDRTLGEIFPGAATALRERLGAGARRAFCIAPVGARQGQALALVCRPLAEGDWEGTLLPLAGGSGREAQILSELLHDLRTPLTTLLGAAELLETGRPGPLPERVAGLLKVAAGAATQITGLLDKASARRGAPETGEAK